MTHPAAWQRPRSPRMLLDAAKDAEAGDGPGDTTVSMWHAMQAPLFPEPDGSEDEDT